MMTIILEIVICFVPLLSGILLEYLSIPPHRRPIPYQYLQTTTDYIWNLNYNEQLQGPTGQDGETITTTQLIVLSIVLPLTVQLVLCWWRWRCRNCRRHSLCWYSCCFFFQRSSSSSSSRRSPLLSSQASITIHKTICVYLCAFGLVITLTNCLKLYMGYLRPIFYEICQPMIEQHQEQQDDDGDGDNDNNSNNELVCSSDEDAREARLSFPSGHASMSVCGMLLLSLFLEEECFGQTAFVRNKIRIMNNVIEKMMMEQRTTTRATRRRRRTGIEMEMERHHHHHHQQLQQQQQEQEEEEPFPVETERERGGGIEEDGTNQLTGNGTFYDDDDDDDDNDDVYYHSERSSISPTSLSSRQFMVLRFVTLCCYTPMLLALFIASSRVHDNKHFPADVVGGSLLGGSIAILVHRTWFPLPSLSLGLGI